MFVEHQNSIGQKLVIRNFLVFVFFELSGDKSMQSLFDQRRFYVFYKPHIFGDKKQSASDWQKYFKSSGTL